MRAAAIAAALTLTCWSGRAAASAFSVEGFGPVGVAEIGARAARADDGTATFYNPAGLGLGAGVRVEIAPTLGVSALSAAGRKPSLADPFGVAIAFDATVPFEGFLKDRLRFGIGVYVMSSGLARVIAKPETEPLFPYFDNRTQRLVALPAIGVKLTRGLSVGAGLDVLGGVAGPAAATPGPTGAPEPRIDIDGSTRFAAVVGARWDPAPFAHVALVYRQRFYVPARVETSAEIGGIPLAISVDGRQSLFDADTVVAATSFDAGRLSLELDVAYAAWSAYTGPTVAVHAELPAVSIDGTHPAAIARDVVSARGAASYRAPIGAHALTLRGGLGFEPTMLTSFQQGRSNLVDGDKIFVGLGASLELAHVLGRALRFGLGVNTTVVTAYAQDKRVCFAAPCPPGTIAGPDGAHPSQGITEPGFPTLRGGGAFVSGSFGVGVDL